MTDPWILCVDDDERLLDGLELQLGFDHQVRTAPGGAEGLALLAEHPGCAVVISDMRMPNMNGAEFLARVREESPDTTRMLLTGFSDLSDTISAVNDGGIFRFLTKPIPPEQLEAAVDAGLRQWELVVAERVLLEETLQGAARTLIEALEIAAPETFARARRIELGCRHAATKLGIEPVWEVALAGLLYRVGWIALPVDLIERYLSGVQLPLAARTMIADADQTTLRLIGRIPRLDGVAALIEQAAIVDPAADPPSAAAVVRTVADLDDAQRRGLRPSEALDVLADRHHRDVLAALRNRAVDPSETQVREVTLRQLSAGSIAVRDIITPNGGLLVKAGSELTEIVIMRLGNFARTHGVLEPISVRMAPDQLID